MIDTVSDTHHFHPPTGPVLLSVPHAGRAYDPAVVAGLRVPPEKAMLLEDRYADFLVAQAIAAHVPAIIARAPRLVIDLNRAPDDLDPGAIRGGVGYGMPPSAKARAGLGLVPTRLWGIGPLWRTALDPAVVSARMRTIHAPYHAAIAYALAMARCDFGAAVLIDVHSMPPIGGDAAPEIVIGDRFGASAATQITANALAVLTQLGFRVAVNTPYAGGYIVARHGAPAANVHALQIEVDRGLYLDAAFDRPGSGLVRIQRAIAALVETLRQELVGGFAAAAE
jgi:N-formylglutamate amidohydrolase